jgi:hypothetical protein
LPFFYLNQRNNPNRGYLFPVPLWQYGKPQAELHQQRVQSEWVEAVLNTSENLINKT